MNVLQSFMGCMYPGSIKTESIESLDHDPSCRYQVSNIDEKAEEVSKGEIQLTERDLIYFRPGKFPIRWSLGCIRRYGCTEGGEIFTFETGRKSPTGEGIYAFNLNEGHDLVNRLKEKLERGSNRSEPDGQASGSRRKSSFRLSRNCVRSALDHPFNCNNYTIDSLDPSPKRHTSHIVTSQRDKISRNPNNPSSSEQPKPLPSTYTDLETLSINSPKNNETKTRVDPNDVKKLPYSKINANVTQSLNELAQAHAAHRLTR